MSIPPLVCSTPPPPEQCEDDKDHEDSDISYNLSQEDDEDCSDYNYGNYSSYSIYQNNKNEVRESMVKEKWDSNLSDVLVNQNEDNNRSSQLNGDNFTSNNNLQIGSITKFEDSVVEDLNLIVDNDSLHSNDLGLKEDDSEVHVNDECQENNTRIQDEGGTNILIKDENNALSVSVPNNIHIPNENLDIKNEDILLASTVEGTTNQIHEISIENDLPHKTKETEENAFQQQEIDTLVTESPEISIDISVNKIEDETTTDDEFGDFEDFQLTSSQNCQVLTVSTENPWENNCNKDDEFCTFTANFDLNRTESLEKIDNVILCEQTQNKMNKLEDSDDDFGNFGDFRSSENKDTMSHTKEVTSNLDVPVWSLQSSDNDLHVEDSINSVLASIFAQEIPDFENALLGKLESFLSETWGHLIDIDIRQPYMINWNNSLGQKTLLKALSIDSRNILFGPKWSYNTPKYAINLNTAPLQPQKQFVSYTSGTEPAEKVPKKETGTWVDPFTTDGQEYTYAEALLLDLEHLMATLDQMAHKHSTLKISELLACHTENENMGPETVKRPIVIDAVESKSSTKSNTIYSSTINVQPLRHISLPDTHIFTPTDSETPRSKKIHYDSGSSSLAPKQAQENNKCQSDNLSAQLSSVENEYWDFQDFKGSNVAISQVNTVTSTEQTDVNVTNEKIVHGGVSYQTQILQPIKLEPVIPTLNWPDPGEVKETFNDFSDFISSHSWNDDKGSKGVEPSLDVQHNNQSLQYFKEHEQITDNVEDDFEIFQSAPPTTSAMGQSINSKTRSQMVVSENVTLKNNDICDNSSVKIEFKNIKQHNNVLDQNASMSSSSTNMQKDFTQQQTILGIKNNSEMLQPVSTSSSGLNRQLHKSDQILQPLSLESYSQINWPNPGIDLQDLSRFNPINSLHSLKSDTSTSGNSKSASPAHNSVSSGSNQADDDIWGDFVSICVPKQQQQTPKKAQTFADDDEWTDFVSSPSIKPQNGLNTISFNVHTNLSMQKPCQNKFGPTSNQIPIDIPTLNYITPKSNNRGVYSEKHFQNL